MIHSVRVAPIHTALIAIFSWAIQLTAQTLPMKLLKNLSRQTTDSITRVVKL
jgi:hypothetical protein